MKSNLKGKSNPLFQKRFDILIDIRLSETYLVYVFLTLMIEKIDKSKVISKSGFLSSNVVKVSLIALEPMQ